MKSISIVCDACGQRATIFNAVILVAASTDTALRPETGPGRTSIPKACPNCKAVWTGLQPGDEFLIGLTRMARPAPRSPSAGIA